MKDLFGDNSYKYGLETFLLLYLDRFQFVLGSDLEDFADRDSFSRDNPCHIYFVLKRPKVTADPNSIKCTGKKVKVDFLYNSPKKTSRVNLVFEFQNAKSKVSCITEYPYNLIVFGDQQSPLLVGRPSTLLDSKIVGNNIIDDDLDFEILYIGQAIGKNGERTALDRLAKHETVQKIYMKALTDWPECDIWIMLSSFAQGSLMFAAGKDLINVKSTRKALENKKLKHVIRNDGLSLSKRQIINLTEASLIRYFEPEYNLMFKENFPDVRHHSYSELYELDVRAVNIELNTSDVIRKIFTKKSGRREVHSHMFEFITDRDRISFLDILPNSKD